MAPNERGEKILVVDDVPLNVTLLDRILRDEGYEVICAYSGESAIRKTISELPDLVLLDVTMPQMNGYEVCRRIKADDRVKDVPVMFISALAKTANKVEALSAGGVDYITKPFQAGEVVARIGIHLEIRSLQKQLEEKNAILEREIIKRREIEKELKILAATDNLTKAFNRRHFFELATKELSRSKRFGKHFSVIMMDIDHFKRINDTYGHLVGDQVLVRVAKLCQGSLRNDDVLGRYGGEEFVVMAPDTDVNEAEVVAERLLHSVVDHEMEFNGYKFYITASFGVACLNPGEELTLEQVLDQADQALYRSKQNGRSCVTIW